MCYSIAGYDPKRNPGIEFTHQAYTYNSKCFISNFIDTGKDDSKVYDYRCY